MTTTGDGNADLAADSFTAEDHVNKLRRVQFYMMRMDMRHSVDSPLEYLKPYLQEHVLWLEEQEKNGVLFLSGANIAGNEWDGSGTAIIRAPSLQAAVAISDTEPFHREGLRVNTVHGWQLNEGTVHLSFSLFTGKFSLS